jgi:hypothetical protein
LEIALDRMRDYLRRKKRWIGIKQNQLSSRMMR